MKQTRSIFSSRSRPSLSLLLAALLLLCCSGCSKSRGNQKDTLRIGVALYTQDDTFISTVTQHLQRAVQTQEAQQGRKITLSVADGRSNQTTQLDQIDQFLSRGYDILCVNIVDRTAAAVIIDKAKDANVPLIFFNRQPVAEDIARWSQVYYVGAQAEQSGTLQGALVRDAWLEDAASIDRNADQILQYVMLEGEPGHQDALLRTEYAIQTLTQAGISTQKLASATANWNRAQAAARMRTWLSLYADQIEVVFANNDDMALGAIDAYQEAGLPLPMIVGVDATPPALEAIQEGTLYGTVQNDAAGIADAMLDLALALCEGQDPAQAVTLEQSHYVWLPYRQVSAANMEDFLSEE